MVIKTLFTDQYTDIYEFVNQKILKFLWKETSQYISEEDYKNHVTLWANTVEAKKPIGILVDTRKHFVTIDPDLQAWFVNVIFPKYVASSIKKFAFLESEDFISQLSIEQTMEEDTNLPFQTRYFSDEKTALTWILG